MQGSPRIDELRQKFHENPRRYFAPLANEYRKAGDPEQAIAICRAHLAQQPGHMSGHVVYGQALYDAKRPDEARVVFEKALTLDPDNAVVLRQLGDIAREKGDTAEAKHWYGRTLDADSGDREVAAYLAELTEPLSAGAAPEGETPQEPVAAETPADDTEQSETAPETGMPAEVVHEASPFVTRTMAELYAKQGYRSAALDVYRQLALHNPDDREIMDRIQELSEEPPPEAAPQPEPAAEAESHEAAAEAITPIESHIDDDAFAFQELDNEIDLAGADEEQAVVEDAEAAPDPNPPHPDKHFTEMDLVASGDSWDSDSWAAGFSEDEVLAPEFESPITPAEPEPQPEPVVEPAPIVAEQHDAEPMVEYEREPETEPIVAYSPELPDDDELPHFAPKGPTVREFFATLGAKRPPASNSITARAAVPEIRNQPAAPESDTSELPLATDAFANMFANEPVNEDDARAAFALSGAIAASETPASKVPTPPRPVPAQEAPLPAAPAMTEESEEDIRRFREWLDGLSEP